MPIENEICLLCYSNAQRYFINDIANCFFFTPGEAPTISNLPKTISIPEDEGTVDPIYTVYAQHISNTIYGISGNVMEMPVPLTFTLDPSVVDFDMTVTPSPPDIPVAPDYVYQGMKEMELLCTLI